MDASKAERHCVAAPKLLYPSRGFLPSQKRERRTVSVQPQRFGNLRGLSSQSRKEKCHGEKLTNRFSQRRLALSASHQMTYELTTWRIFIADCLGLFSARLHAPSLRRQHPEHVAEANPGRHAIRSRRSISQKQRMAMGAECLEWTLSQREIE
jgi:hypothetical protein